MARTTNDQGVLVINRGEEEASKNNQTRSPLLLLLLPGVASCFLKAEGSQTIMEAELLLLQM